MAMKNIFIKWFIIKEQKKLVLINDSSLVHNDKLTIFRLLLGTQGLLIRLKESNVTLSHDIYPQNHRQVLFYQNRS